MTGQTEEIQSYVLHDDGRFPNHPHWPLLIYPKALSLTADDPAASVEQVFWGNGWTGAWRDGIYRFHHYHSNTHEVLGVFSGTARVQFGGPGGVEIELKAGDVAVLPAGTAHRNVGSSRDLGVVGAYPHGAAYDMCYGKEEERSRAMQNIAAVARPRTDPVFGTQGGLCEWWPQSRGTG